MTKARKKLIEVALPLEAINAASAREKSIRHGHPSTLHLWWARRPLAAARAVIFAQMVDDPSEYTDVLLSDPQLKAAARRELKKRLDARAGGEADLPEPSLAECAADLERERLFRIIEDLVKWENTTNEAVLQRARDEIWQSWRRACADNADHPRASELFDRNKLPAFHDPFAGGGSLPLEAQRLGLEAYASDLNPVAVLINKAMIEIPPKFTGRPPVNPRSRLGLFGQSDQNGRKGKDKQDSQDEEDNPDTDPDPNPAHPVNPVPSGNSVWRGAQGLAEDVRYYGQWMRDEAEKRIGHLYPKVQVIRDAGGHYRHATPEEIAARNPRIEHLTVIAWLWARTVKSPNPAFAHVDVPLASTFMLSTKAGKEAYVEVVIHEERGAGSGKQEAGDEERGAGSGKQEAGDEERGAGSGKQEARADDSRSSLPASSFPLARSYSFTVKHGKPPEAAKSGTKLARGANFKCVMSGTPIAPDHIYGEANAGRMGARLMAIVAEGERGRVYLAPALEHEATAKQAHPEWKPDVEMPNNPRWFSPPLYGLKTYGDLFTPRQLVALTTFSDLVGEAMERVRADALAAGLPDDPSAGSGQTATPLREGGVGAMAYAEAVGVYLAFAKSKACNRNTSLCIWEHRMDRLVATFGRQALPMVWDFAETNPLAGAGGDIYGTIESVAEVLDRQFNHTGVGYAEQANASDQSLACDRIVSTDPPYYDNIGYADLSDFFYLWLRRSIRAIYPTTLATVATPKQDELVATPYRHNGKEQAEAFFLNGMTGAMRRLAEQTHPAFPATIYYAFKQSETESDSGTSSTGWETFIDAVIRAGFSISGTWPMRTEQPKGLRAFEQNALASSIVLVCRKRAADAPAATRREFVAALKAELPRALAQLQRGNIAPVDLAQAAIGPGMAVYTRYGQVLDAEGRPLTVREALALINQTLDEALAEQEGDFDADSRWALAWFEQHGFNEAEFGQAETLSKAKNTSVAGMVEAGILESRRGKVRLLRPAELPAGWDPAGDARLTAWETVHQLIRALESGGESDAAALVAALGGRAEVARELAYRLYTLCERKKRAAEALSYNALVQSWPEIVRLSQQESESAAGPAQPGLFNREG